MKHLHKYLAVLFFTFGFVFSAFCQQDSNQLIIKISPNKLGKVHEYWKNVQVVSDDTIINSSFTKYDSLMVDSIPLGTYMVNLKSVFNHLLSKPVIIEKDTCKELEFDEAKNFYSIISGGVNFCQTMEVSDTLIILYNEQGSFSKATGKIQIIKQADASWNVQLCNFHTGELLKERQIGNTQFIEIIKFEKKLNSHRFKDKCNTVVYCSYNLGKQVKRIEDRSCSWNDYKKLEQVFFP